MLNQFDSLSQGNNSVKETVFESQREQQLGDDKFRVTTKLTLNIETPRYPSATLKVTYFDLQDGKEVARYKLSLRSRWFSVLVYPMVMSEKFDFLIDGGISYSYGEKFEVSPWLGSYILKERLQAVPQFIDYLSNNRIIPKGVKVCSLVYGDSKTAKTEKRKKIDVGLWTVRMMDRYNRDHKNVEYKRVSRLPHFVRIFYS